MRARPDADEIRCAACGGAGGRVTAKYCSVCGKSLGTGYEPLDTIRASYGMQNKEIQIEKLMEADAQLFESGRSGVAQTAWACVVYSMVPYLGVLFLPFAFAVSSFGYLAPADRAGAGDRRPSAICFGLSIAILLVQLVLWSLLYLIPELAGGASFPN